MGSEAMRALDRFSPAAEYPHIGVVDDDRFAMPAPDTMFKVNIDSEPSPIDYRWPEGLDTQVFDRDFQTPFAGASMDVSSFDHEFQQPAAEWSALSQQEESVSGDDLEFHQALQQMVDGGEMASRTTISDEALTDHSYDYSTEGIRYP